MKNEKRFKAGCRSIMENFDQPEEQLRGFFCQSIEKEHDRIDNFIREFYGKFGAEKGTELENIFCDFESAMVSVSFSFGYVFGQMFDIPFSELQKAIEAIKRVLKEEKLIPYFPKERKAA